MAPIHEAAARGDLEGVMRLTEQNPGVIDSIGRFGRTALHIASWHGHVEVACYLLDQEANINMRDAQRQTALLEACYQGHFELVELLMSRGANPTVADSGGMTPLMGAAMYDRVAVVRSLLSFRAVRAVIDARNNDGWTALWWAAHESRWGVMRLLVEAGANPMVADNDGTIPLDIAQQQGHHGCAQLLQVVKRISTEGASSTPFHSRLE